jgi:8-oxoguanine DNA glycosylase-like protein
VARGEAAWVARRRAFRCLRAPSFFAPGCITTRVSVVGVRIGVVDERDEGLGVPAECAAWCRVQQYGVTVLDDMATVDLDWWNQRLAERDIRVRLTGRNPDGAPTDRGVAVIARGDLTACAAGDGGLGDVGVLYAAAAWLSAHRDRDRLRRFLDVRTTSGPGREYDVITAALAACRQPHLLSAAPVGRGRRWSGWPHAPGVGPTVLSLYCWATHRGTGHDVVGHGAAARGVVRPQLLDQQAVASLIHLGWSEDPVAARFTWVRYTRYCRLLHAWAVQAEVAAELIEMWLVARWRERTARHYTAPTGTGEVAN